MTDKLDREQLVDLLEYIGSSEIKNYESRKDIQFCCTIHGENTPSAGVSIEKNLFNCFSCHAKGTVSWLVYKSLPDEFKSLSQVEKFLLDRYNVDVSESKSVATSNKIKRYDDFYLPEELPTRFELPIFKLAPFKSGKQTYDYFLDRGFSKEIVKRFKIGRDLQHETVTIPVFWEDGVLAGVIGRFIDPNRPKNARYKIYEFPKGSLIFPLDKLEVIDDTIILVEGILDAIWLHQLGFTNAVSILGNGMSKAQAKMIKRRCSSVIDMFDNDRGGVTAREIARKELGKDIVYYTTEYPQDKYDPQELNKEEIQLMIDNKKPLNTRKIPRL